VIEEKLIDLLEEKFREPAFADCFLVDIKQPSPTKIEVYIDSDTSLTHQTCQAISRYLEAYLDEEGWHGGKYTLDVSSPGVGRPLKLVRQYRKNLGRRLEVNKLEGKPQTGELVEVTDEAITIEFETTIKEGKKKRKQLVREAIPYDQIKKATVKISFS